MDQSSRYYLFANDGVKRLSRRVLDGLIQGRDALPKYANSKQRMVNVLVALENGKPTEIVGATGAFFEFDTDGRIDESLQRSAIRAMQTFDDLERSQRAKPGGVVDLQPVLNRKRWSEENRWTPSKEDLDLIAADIWKKGGSGSAKVEVAKGVAAKRPALTYEARNALHEATVALVTADYKLNDLSEVALKGLAFEARRRGQDGLGDPLFMGLAEVADRRREILARRRHGRGVWFAVVEATVWDTYRQEGTTHVLGEQRCSSKKEAEEAARTLLSKNAKHFNGDTSIEASVLSELEWIPEKRGRPGSGS